jgi:KDO2-lipid IV(A) lauroyltransferase
MLNSHHQPQLPFADRKFWQPRYWLTWLGLGLLWCWLQLPLGGQIRLAQLVSRTLYHLGRRRRYITSTNIQLCFPELSLPQKTQLVKRIFFENTFGLVETARTFWASEHELMQLKKQTRFADFPQIQQALERKKGIILIGAHYSTLDLGGVLFSLFADVTILYRPHNNALFDVFLKQARQRWATDVLANSQMKSIVRALRRGNILWFPADQDYGLQQSVIAPFFGIPAATITTPARLAKLTGSAILVLGHHRLPDHQHYQLTLETLIDPPIDNDIACATLINSAIEKQIGYFPAQYMWPHRRFKHQLDAKNFYPNI